MWMHNRKVADAYAAAHEHHVFEENLFEDGIMYYMSDCMKNRNYYVFTITPDGYEREVVYF